MWFEHFRRGAAPAEYVLQPDFGGDGHFLFTEGTGARYWVPALRDFLRKHGVPFGTKQAT